MTEETLPPFGELGGFKGPKKTLPEWATYCPTRTSKRGFKVHNNRGNALNAMKTHLFGVLYHFEDNEWREVYRIEKNQFSKYYKYATEEYYTQPHLPRNCQSCNKELMQKDWSRKGQELSHRSYLKWYHQPSIHLKIVCGDCNDKR